MSSLSSGWGVFPCYYFLRIGTYFSFERQLKKNLLNTPAAPHPSPGMRVFQYFHPLKKPTSPEKQYTQNRFIPTITSSVLLGLKLKPHDGTVCELSTLMCSAITNLVGGGKYGWRELAIDLTSIKFPSLGGLWDDVRLVDSVWRWFLISQVTRPSLCDVIGSSDVMHFW